MHLNVADPNTCPDELLSAPIAPVISEDSPSDPTGDAPIMSDNDCLSPVEPVAVTESVVAAQISAAEPDPGGFAGLGLSKTLMRTLAQQGYTQPTPIQERTIPILLEGRDLLGQAQTGSGKTAAFALPLLQRINLSIDRPQILVLVPTRELAIQVAAAFERYAAGMASLRVVAIYGGAAYQPQFSMLKRGAHVVVGTPGRVMDHMNRGSLNLDALQCLVLDEADEMLRMGFAESVDWVLSQLPGERQIALFSATLPGPIRQIAQKYLRNPAEITIRQKTTTADTIRQRYVVVAPHQKESALGRILEAEPVDGAIVFVKMKSTTEPLAEFLNASGFRAAALNGDLAQAQRERIIDHLKSGKLDIIVATDVAARGLDVQRISHVINYDLPGDNESYVHRIGRTGRAGRSGEAILFLHPKAKRALSSLEHATRQKFELMDLPTNRLINKQRVARFHAKIMDMMSHPQAAAMGSIVEQFRREQPDLPIDQLLAALAVMSTAGQPLLLKEEFRQASFVESRRTDDRGRRGPAGHDRDDSRSQGFPPRRPQHPRSGEDAGGARRRDSGLETYRIEVGHAHQVKPGNIVGAIANEAGLDSARIGRIEIFDDFSTVDLPEGMPQEIFTSLQKVWVSGRQLRISRMNDRPHSPRDHRPEEARRNVRPPRPGGGRKPRREAVRS